MCYTQCSHSDHKALEKTITPHVVITLNKQKINTSRNNGIDKELLNFNTSVLNKHLLSCYRRVLIDTFVLAVHELVLPLTLYFQIHRTELTPLSF